METIWLICDANQINGLYMMKPLAFNGLRQNVKKLSPIFFIFFYILLLINVENQSHT